MTTPKLMCQELPFNGFGLPTPWSAATTQTAGTPAVTMTDEGFVRLSLDATAEVQVARLSFGNVLSFPAAKLDSIDFWAKVSSALAAACSLIMGVTGDGNDTQASIAQRAAFKLTGGGNLTVDCVDGTNSQVGVATGFAFPSTDWTKFSINFKQGHITIGPPANNVGGVGGLADVKFKIENAQGLLRPVAQRTQFDLSAYSGGLQPYFQLQKSANAATATLDVRHVTVNYRL